MTETDRIIEEKLWSNLKKTLGSEQFFKVFKKHIIDSVEKMNNLTEDEKDIERIILIAYTIGEARSLESKKSK